MKRILIAEDEKTYAEALTFRLHKEGYDVTVARDGAIALSLIAGKGPFDLLILDLIMPNMDGFQLLAALRTAAPGLKPLVLSNLNQSAVIQRVLALGAVEFISKSDVTLDSLVKRITVLVGDASA